MASERSSKRLQISTSASIDASYPASPQHSPTHQPCKTTVLLIVMHAGSVLGKYLLELIIQINYNLINLFIKIYFRC